MGEQSLMAGSGRIDITPPLPVERGGSFRLMEVTKVYTPLMAHSIAVSQGDEAFIWTSVDLGSLGRGRSDRFRERVIEATGLAEHQVHISTTHCHGAPTGPGDFQIYANDERQEKAWRVYQDMMEKAAASAIEAWNNRRPVKVGHGVGNIERACFNRRWIMSTGRSAMHGKSENGETRIQIEGPVDDTLQVVWFIDEQTGGYVAALVNAATHPNQSYGLEGLHADFPGEMRQCIWGALQENFPILFLQGACGDVQPVDLKDDPTWGKKLEGIRTIGRHIAGEVIKVMHASRPVSGQTLALHTDHVHVSLDFREFPPEDIRQIMQLFEQSRQASDPKAFLDPHLDTLTKKAHAKAVALIEQLKAEHGSSQTIRLSGICIGDLYFVLTPAHQFVQFQMDLKQALPGRKVMLVDLTDDVVNYVPTRLAIALGGYETEHRRYMPDAGERIVAAGIELVNRLHAIGKDADAHAYGLQYGNA